MKTRTVLLLLSVMLFGNYEVKAQWDVGGNNFTVNPTAARKFGTISNGDVQIITNNVNCGRITTAGNWGIGSNNVVAGYALTVNSISNGIRITDPGNGYSIYSVKSGSGYSAYFEKTNSGSSSPVIYGYNSGGGSAIQGYSDDSYGIQGISQWGNGIYGSTTAGLYAGYFEGNVYTTGVYLPSDENLKKNIRDFTRAMDVISKLHPKQYEYKQEGTYKLMSLPKGNHFGLTVQDVEKILPNLVKDSKFEAGMAEPDKSETKNSETINFKALNYTELIPVIIKGMQEQQAVIEKQQQQIDELKATIAGTKSNIPSLSSTRIAPSNVSLEQNVPNPFGHTTSISYTLPQKFTNAYILFRDQNGKTLKQVNVFGEGKGILDIDAEILYSPGVYNYSLIIDGRVVSTKQMVFTR